MEIRWCDSSNWSDGWITDPPLRPRLDRTIRRKWMTYEKHLSNACVIRHLRVVFGPQGRCAKIPVPRAVRCVGTGFCPCSSCVHIMNLTLRMAPFLKKYFPLVGWLLYSTREKIKMSTIAIHMTMNRPVQDRSKQNRQTPEKIIIITTTTTTEITTMTVRRRTYWTLITGMTCQVKPITMHSMIRLDMLLFRHRPILTAVLHPTRVLRMGTPHRMLIRRLRTVHLLKDNIRMLLFPRGCDAGISWCTTGLPGSTVSRSNAYRGTGPSGIRTITSYRTGSLVATTIGSTHSFPLSTVSATPTTTTLLVKSISRNRNVSFPDLCVRFFKSVWSIVVGVFVVGFPPELQFDVHLERKYKKNNIT